MAQLQEEYSDIEVEVIGVAANEEAATADEARAQVDAWVTKRLPNSNIRIAFDHSGEMDKYWLDASPSFMFHRRSLSIETAASPLSVIRMHSRTFCQK
ncbi:hypothetical protein GCM10007919_67400 [Rhizobium indigoferae]|nr:hypothetical protein GCM10007919_67400 [Rhizobium indigoferae]